MQKSHGLFVPHRQHLAVDLETLFRYLHLVIHDYRECLQCGTQRNTVQAVQQHMTGKGHCNFDMSDPESEFADFYDFSEPEGSSEDSDEDEVEVEQNGDSKATATSSTSSAPQRADEDSIRLPSGKIISKRSTTIPTGQTSNHTRRRKNLQQQSLLEADKSVTKGPDPSEQEDTDTAEKDQRVVISKKERREKAMMVTQMAKLSANDRTSLMHLPVSQQLSILAAQHRNEKKMQKEEKRRRSRIDRKGNKNLYACHTPGDNYNTETPVYMAG
jgi:pre-60S factor REI1